MTLALILPCVAAALGQALPSPPEPAEKVVFVCEHGNVKSLIAREWFNRLAAERGLAARAVSRGLRPGASVPPAVADALRSDGFDVSGFEPRALGAADVTGAIRLIGIGVDLTPAEGGAHPPRERWDGIPPASERYAASRDALRARIEALLVALARAEPGR